VIPGSLFHAKMLGFFFTQRRHERKVSERKGKNNLLFFFFAGETLSPILTLFALFAPLRENFFPDAPL
jgi:hypothetical protein